MAIADVKDYQSLQRDILVRMTFAFDLTNFLQLVSGSTYALPDPIGLNFVRVEENGSSVSFSNSHAGEDTRTSATLTSAPSSSNPVIAYLYKHFATGPTKFLDRDDPTGAISNLVEWKSTVLTGITLRENSSIIDGRLSLASSSISLIDTDLEIDYLLNYKYFDYSSSLLFLNNVSLSNQNISIWLGLDDNYDLVFSGRMADLIFSGYKVTINTKDGFRELISDAYCGDLESESVIKTANYPNIDENSIDGKPIRLFFGHLTPFKGTRTTIASTSYSDRTVLASSLPDCYNIIYEQTYNANKNNKWILGRFPSGEFNTSTYNLVVKNYNTTTWTSDVWYQVGLSADEIKKVHPGMNITVTMSDDSTNIVTVHSVDYDDSVVGSGSAGWFSFYITSPSAVGLKTPFASNPIVVNHSWGIVYKVGGGSWGSVIDGTNQINQPDCTVTKTTTEAGHELVEVELTGTATPVAIDGETEFKFYAAQSNDTQVHTLLKELVEGAGYTVDATSFASSVDKDVVEVIPELTSDEFPTYLSVISKITESTGYGISFGSDDKVYLNNIYLFLNDNPALTIDHNIYNYDIIDGSFSWSYLTSNIAPTIKSKSSYFIDKKIDGPSIYNEENLQEQQLHKSTKTKVISSVYPSGNELFSDTISTVSKLPRRIYRFSLPMKFYNINIYDVIELQGFGAAGSYNEERSIRYIRNNDRGLSNYSRRMVVTSITKTLEAILIEAYSDPIFVP